MTIEQISKQVAAALLRDLTDRRGLDQAWDEIDADIQVEIVASWEKIVSSELQGLLK